MFSYVLIWLLPSYITVASLPEPDSQIPKTFPCFAGSPQFPRIFGEMALWEWSEAADGNGSPMFYHCRIEPSGFVVSSGEDLRMGSSDDTENSFLPGAGDSGSPATPISLQLVVNYM